MKKVLLSVYEENGDRIFITLRKSSSFRRNHYFISRLQEGFLEFHQF